MLFLYCQLWKHSTFIECAFDFEKTAYLIFGYVLVSGKSIFAVDIHPDGSRFATGGQGMYTVRIGMSGSRYSSVDQVKFFKGCLPQILLGPFLNNLTHLLLMFFVALLKLLSKAASLVHSWKSCVIHLDLSFSFGVCYI